MTVRLPDFDPYEFLVKRRFPGIPLVHLISEIPPYQLSRDVNVRAVIQSRREAAELYWGELKAMPRDAFEALLRTEQAKEVEELRMKADIEEAKRFFHQPHANADYNHWSRASHWSLDEAIALSFGKAPEVVKWKFLEPLRSQSPFAFQYGRLLDLAERAKAWEKLFDPVLPGIFIAWARENEIQFPQELEDAVRARGNNVASWKTHYDEMKRMYDELLVAARKARSDAEEVVRQISAQRDDALHRLQLAEQKAASSDLDVVARPFSTRERDSLLKLIIGMAAGWYGYDPSAKKSDKVSEIAADLERAGVALDVDTVRKWLKAAAELLPPKETE